MSVRPTRWLMLASGLASGKLIFGAAGVWANTAVPRHRLQRAMSPVRIEEEIMGWRGKRRLARRVQRTSGAPRTFGHTIDAKARRRRASPRPRGRRRRAPPVAPRRARHARGHAGAPKR